MVITGELFVFTFRLKSIAGYMLKHNLWIAR